MKKPLSMPAIVAAVIVVLAGVIFGIMKVNAGTAEFEKPKVAPGIPTTFVRVCLLSNLKN